MTLHRRRGGVFGRFGWSCAAIGLAAVAAASWTGCSGSPSSDPAANQPQAAGEAVAKSPETGGTPLAPPAGADQLSARDVLDRMVGAYKRATSYSDKGQVRMSGKFDGQAREDTSSYMFAFQRPNKLRMEVFGGIAVDDGEHLWAAVVNLPNHVLQRSTPATLAPGSVFDDLIFAGAVAQGPTQVYSWVPLQAILLWADDPLKSLLATAEEPQLLAPEAIGPHACYRVAAKRPDGTAVFWVDQASYVLRRFEVPTEEMEKVFAAGRVQDFALTIELSDAAMNATIDPNLLTFQPPTEATIVDGFQPPGLDMLGKPAPAYRFVDLKGNPVTPESVAGKVVVLSIWATWCAPCRETLPTLESAYQKFKDNPRVEFLAVSVDQPSVDNAAMENLFRQLQVTVPIVRDPQQDALDSFGISGVPTMVVLDASGKVQGFETGMMPGLETGLPAVLGELLAGEDIYERKVDNFQKGKARFERWLAQRAKDDNYAGPLTFDQEPARAEIAPQSEPQSFTLEKLWTCRQLTEPGNILVVPHEGGTPEIFVIDDGKAVAQVAVDGSVTAVHPLPVSPGQPVRFLRTALATGPVAKPGAESKPAAGARRLFVGAANGGQQLHLMDQDFQPLVTYPEGALESPHDGMGDVEFADLDGDGVPEICVGYWGAVGVQGVSLEGKRIWADRSLGNAVRLAVVGPDPGDKKRRLLSTNEKGTVVTLVEGGQQAGEFAVPNFPLYWIVAEDLDGDGRQELCGLSPTATGDFVAVGFDMHGQLLWSYPLPPGIHQQPIEPLLAGRLFSEGPRDWLVAAADGSIHVISADGALVDQFSYGTALCGLATAQVNGKPVLLVSTADGLDAWQLTPRRPQEPNPPGSSKESE